MASHTLNESRKEALILDLGRGIERAILVKRYGVSRNTIAHHFKQNKERVLRLQQMASAPLPPLLPTSQDTVQSVTDSITGRNTSISSCNTPLSSGNTELIPGTEEFVAIANWVRVAFREDLMNTRSIAMARGTWGPVSESLRKQYAARGTLATSPPSAPSRPAVAAPAAANPAGDEPISDPGFEAWFCAGQEVTPAELAEYKASTPEGWAECRARYHDEYLLSLK